MKESTGNLWNFRINFPNNYACITTNGYIKPNDACVMGRGCAKEARDIFKGFDRELGRRIKREGNKVHIFMEHRIVSFPTKHNWWEKSDIKLIEQSAKELAYLADSLPNALFYLPRPGCGNGRLRWEEVKPVLEKLLPDNVIVINYKQDGMR